jgi:carbamoyltransferase
MLFSPYLGKEYSKHEIKTTFLNYEGKIQVEEYDDVFSRAAASIADGKIVGWFQGRSECGPRALGNRSILADPRDPDMKDHLNAKVKFREAFRPFAPSIIWERQQEYFDLDIPSPYMLMVSDILEEKRHLIPSVTHVDGTGRLQTVMKELNPQFYRLIERFDEFTGIPIVLNTSFNVRGEPIVETPDDAIRCFLGTGIDELYISNFYIQKLVK